MKPYAPNWKKRLVFAAAAIAAAGFLAYGARLAIQLAIMNRMLAAELAAEKQSAQYQQAYFENQLGLANQNLQDQKSRNDAIESQVSQISGTVGTLQKLSATDPQLLQKYSRVYFLNENYAPASLTNIDAVYLYDKNKPEQFLSQALPHLASLLSDAARADVTLQVASAYRSFAEQSTLKSAYTTTFGSGANRFSADQGYSEHQLGTAVDFAIPVLAPLNLKFASSSAYAWLQANAYKYGFELSYPPKNPYYIFEPWHWRFVGGGLATWLHNNNLNFYDAPQRTINQYLISLFD